MRAHHVMTRNVITVDADASIRAAANLMLKQHISGLPVVDGVGRLIGIVSEGETLSGAARSGRSVRISDGSTS